MMKIEGGDFAVRFGCDTEGCMSDVQVEVSFEEFKAELTGKNTPNHAVAMAAVKKLKELGWKLSGGPGAVVDPGAVAS